MFRENQIVEETILVEEIKRTLKEQHKRTRSIERT